ncbi:unnamed protein product [Ambrosiozyma monospora]|uniref:Unnamed protein product n=1 Tax=Ambrosiozyma monospora TaxID=43982 RepID=A0A9W7DFH9_AMBMO|nr:unnamed protein product [Ambrosiozyma monospora]
MNAYSSSSIESTYGNTIHSSRRTTSISGSSFIENNELTVGLKSSTTSSAASASSPSISAFPTNSALLHREYFAIIEDCLWFIHQFLSSTTDIYQTVHVNTSSDAN